MNKKELLDELQVKFEETKEQLGFNSTFEEIESIYYIKDFVLTSWICKNCKKIVVDYSNKEIREG